jgi:hypothetical protein
MQETCQGKRRKTMKRVCAVLGLALLMGCASSDNTDCPRKDKGCGKSITTAEASAAQQQDTVQ